MTTSDDANFDSTELDCRRFHIVGRVQGVFFRASTQTVARDLGIGGYAKNLPDGSVEVIACGADSDLRKLARWLRDGPPMAQVQNVSEESSEFFEFDDFGIA